MRLILLLTTLCLASLSYANLCPIQIWSNAPYRIEFHYKKPKGPVIGIHDPSKHGFQWIKINQFCFDNQNIYAIATIEGKTQTFITQNSVNNLQSLPTILFPAAFKEYHPLLDLLSVTIQQKS